MAIARTLTLLAVAFAVLAGLAAFGIRSGLPNRPSELGPLSEESSVEDLDSTIRSFAHPFPRGGLYVGVRGSAIRIPQANGGGCVFYNPINLTETVRASLSEWCGEAGLHKGEVAGSDSNNADAPAGSTPNHPAAGGVRYIVVPSDVHHVYLDQFAHAYPGAQIVAADGMQKKHKKLPKEQFAYILTDPLQPPVVPWGDELKLVWAKQYIHEEILLVHTKSSALLVADMIWNMPAPTAYAKVELSASEKEAPLQRWLNEHANPSTNMHKGLVFGAAFGRPSDALKKVMRPIFDEWKPQKIVVQHGEVIKENGLELLTKAWEWTGFPEKQKKE